MMRNDDNHENMKHGWHFRGGAPSPPSPDLQTKWSACRKLGWRHKTKGGSGCRDHAGYGDDLKRSHWQAWSPRVHRIYQLRSQNRNETAPPSGTHGSHPQKQNPKNTSARVGGFIWFHAYKHRAYNPQPWLNHGTRPNWLCLCATRK